MRICTSNDNRDSFKRMIAFKIVVYHIGPKFVKTSAVGENDNKIEIFAWKMGGNASKLCKEGPTVVFPSIPTCSVTGCSSPNYSKWTKL